MSKENEVNVKIINCDCLKDERLFSLNYQLMPDYRKKKIDALQLEKDKRLSLGAGILLEHSLSGYQTDNMLFDEKGKPYLPDCPLRFNLSHSGSISMIATAKSNIGCDVQQIKPVKLEIAKRFFCSTEYQMLSEISDEEEQINLFYRLWTLKESFIKATGLGMSLPMKSFSIGFRDGVPFVNQTVNDFSYSFMEYDIGKPYRFAVCIEGKQDLIKDSTIEIYKIQ